MKKYSKLLCMFIVSFFAFMVSINAVDSVIDIKKSDVILGTGYYENLRYTLGNGLNSSNIIWTSSNEKVATISNGRVVGVSNGETIITATINGKKDACKVVVSSDYVPVTGLSLNKSNVNILVGSSETLIGTVSPGNASNKDIIWTSSNTNVAVVENGKIVAKNVGSAVITASSTSSNYKATSKVNVVDKIPLKGITFDKTNLTIKENATGSLRVNYNPSNATNKKVTWKSSNTNIVRVDNNGNVTGVKPGSATITAVSNDGGYVSLCKVVVESLSKKVTGISLDKKELTLETGNEATLKVTINPGYAENKKVSWSSTDTSIATVDNGVITAKKPGTAEIKVVSDDGGKEAICKVIVKSPPLKSISFENTDKTVYVGSMTRLITIADPIDSVMEKAIWTSTNNEVATVDDGVVTALSIGETTITISNEDKTIEASINVKVIDKPKDKLKITIEGYDLKFDPKIKNYTLKIGSESELKINTNVSKNKVIINGNKKLKNGSIITININDGKKETYVINIKKNENYTIYFIGIISVLLLLNIIRIIVKRKKK